MDASQRSLTTTLSLHTQGGARRLEQVEPSDQQRRRLVSAALERGPNKHSPTHRLGRPSATTLNPTRQFI